MIVPPHAKNSSLIGTAFDYLLRWYVKKLNRNAIDLHWVAENSAPLLYLMREKTALQRAQRVLREARKKYKRYIATKAQNRPDEDLIAHAIRLAQLDVVYRAGVFDEHTFADVEKDAMAELSALMNAVSPERFIGRNTCILNPTFGEASGLVGGADADLLIDGTLIEVKTIRQMRLDRRIFNQLVGYYILARIGGIDSCSRRVRITSLAVYYSRQGLFVPIPLGRIIDEGKLEAFLSWFKTSAAKTYSAQD